MVSQAPPTQGHPEKGHVLVPRKYRTKLDGKGATNHLVNRTREDMEARMVGLTQLLSAECVQAPTGARADGAHRTAGRLREDMHTHHHAGRTNRTERSRTDVKTAHSQHRLGSAHNSRKIHRVAQSGTGSRRYETHLTF